MRSLSFIAAATAVAALPRQLQKPPSYGGVTGTGTGIGGYNGYHQNGESRQERQERSAAVKEMFEFAWNGYYKYAFPNDELLPVNNSFGNSRNGWGASAADALSTALVMENSEIVNQIVNYVPCIDWSVSKDDEAVSLFETTIRYLGGLLSGYDLLSGPLKDLVTDKSKVKALLDQAQNLANNLSYAFDTPTGIPNNDLVFSNRSNTGDVTNGLATTGTLVLEWTRLSDLTGDETYGQLAQKGESYLLNPRPLPFAEPFPGMLGTNVAIENGSFVDNSGGWTGGDDSFYEYLLKMFVYDSSRFGEYKDRWIAAADSTIKYLTSHPSSRPDLTFLAIYEGTKTNKSSEHLACFDGGNFLLGGLVLKEQKYTDFGLQLVDSCEDIYAQTLTGIGPESFAWNTTSLPANQTEFYNKAGFWITSGQYVLRPEVIESFYYAYRVTGDRKYQDYAWSAIQAINATTRVGSGFSSINDVNEAGGGGFMNFQESFWFAEVMKYSYLIHAEDAEWQVDYEGKNQFVFNTESHPLKVAGPPI
ncbi:glycoside hydrolase family 47 protein [Dothistroma septosporum NZE10]|uniref:alpha-1,2-Mannosidase n=1 Tax=Dothistroma septosporum (strain NZE10 / CBS 128990) TaxID=675120 RepID=N1PHW3_DOTSN|nr:glycoside hydrolase family 47 protein [Dothistroma septosporum NZE10]